jgi:predicted secreted protein
MTLSLGIVLYIMIWWMTLFAVLPLGVKTQGEAGEVVEGTPESAPVAPRLLRVVAINTVVAAVAFAFVRDRLPPPGRVLCLPPRPVSPEASLRLDVGRG